MFGEALRFAGCLWSSKLESLKYPHLGITGYRFRETTSKT
jgi:hypothetical protein